MPTSIFKLSIQIVNLGCILVLYKVTYNVTIGSKKFNFINTTSNGGRRLSNSVNYGSFGHKNTNHILRSTHIEEDFKISEKDVKYSNNCIIGRVKEVLSELGNVNGCAQFPSVTRLEYNRDSILKTYESCKEMDMKVSKNDYSDIKGDCFVRFDGDEENEIVTMCKSPIDKGNQIIRVPIELCYTLRSYMECLCDSISGQHGDANSITEDHLTHLKKIRDLLIGKFTKDLDIGGMLDRISGNEGENQIDSFQSRLYKYISYKSLLTIRALIMADHILALDHVLIRVLENPYIKFNSINNNEKELYLLTFALASEYYLKVASSVIKFMYDGKEYEESGENKVKTMWLHHLFNKRVSHIPLMFDKESERQIQEPIVSYKISQRKMVLMDMMGLFTDPLNVVRDKLEYIAKSRSMAQDRSDGLYYSAKVDLKSNVEDVLEKIENELYENDITHKVFSNDIFSINSDELSYILGGDLEDFYMEGNSFDNMMGGTSVDTNTMCTDFFNDYILNKSTAKSIMNHPVDKMISSLNSILNINSMSRFFCTILSHVIRPGEYETDVMESSYMANSAPGIQCKIENDVVNNGSTGNSSNLYSNKGYIVPLIDLCNHSGSKANSSISVNMLGGKAYFMLATTSEIDADGEILVNYGNFDNNVCFLDYGFVSIDYNNNHTFMQVDENIIRDVAKIHNTHTLLPTLFPQGIPPEKVDLIKSLNLFEINDTGDLTEVYKNPYFEGLPVVKYMEFSQRFMANRQGVGPANMYYSTNSNQDRTMYVDRPLSTDNNHYKDSNVNPLIRVDANGIPESRLILLLKILLCKTKRKLDWIKSQEAEKLSASINSPIDYTAFKMASSIPLIQMNEKYNYTLYEDYKRAFSDRRMGSNGDLGGLKFKELRSRGWKVANSMVLAHAMRQKIPIYKCSAFYSGISRTPVPEANVNQRRT